MRPVRLHSGEVDSDLSIVPAHRTINEIVIGVT